MSFDFFIFRELGKLTNSKMIYLLNYTPFYFNLVQLFKFSTYSLNCQSKPISTTFKNSLALPLVSVKNRLNRHLRGFLFVGVLLDIVKF